MKKSYQITKMHGHMLKATKSVRVNSKKIFWLKIIMSLLELISSAIFAWPQYSNRCFKGK